MGDTIKGGWKDLGFNAEMKKGAEESKFIAGEAFDIRLDELTFNRIIRFRNLPTKPQGNEAGKMYYDAGTKKLMMWINEIGKWAEVVYTTTSTSTTTTSTSTSTTSTSSSSTSTTTS